VLPGDDPYIEPECYPDDPDDDDDEEDLEGEWTL